MVSSTSNPVLLLAADTIYRRPVSALLLDFINLLMLFSSTSLIGGGRPGDGRPFHLSYPSTIVLMLASNTDQFPRMLLGSVLRCQPDRFCGHCVFVVEIGTSTAAVVIAITATTHARPCRYCDCLITASPKPRWSRSFTRCWAESTAFTARPGAGSCGRSRPGRSSGWCGSFGLVSQSDDVRRTTTS